MQINHRNLALSLMVSILICLSGSFSRLRADNGTCNGVNVTLPFLDVAGNPFFCQIAQAFFSGLTNGTSATTYSPNDNVTRSQMAAFVTRTLDQALRRGSRRAVLGQWWTQQSIQSSALTGVGSGPRAVRFDGKSLWVANSFSGTVTRVQASTGKAIETWLGMDKPENLLLANGRVYITGVNDAGSKLYVIDPRQPAGNATLLADLGSVKADGLAFDGEYILIACRNAGLTLYHVASGAQATYKQNFTDLRGALYDGSAFWVIDAGNHKLKKVSAAGQLLQAVNTGVSGSPEHMTFDGANIWVLRPGADALTVVQAATGAVVATLTGNGLDGPASAAFDGERILVTNRDSNGVSLWRATDLKPLGSFSTGANTHPTGACSDGLNFWITLLSTGELARY
jgi:DNA-binding beta-propeller fold protein YncE